MSCFGPNYNPQPPREWYRFENQCAYSSSPILARNGIQYQLDVLKKGNVLQYKNNSSNITKNQRYAQIAKGMWTNRTTSWASQTETYTNPNTSSLKRVGYYNINSNATPIVNLTGRNVNSPNNGAFFSYQATLSPLTCATINNTPPYYPALPDNVGNPILSPGSTVPDVVPPVFTPPPKPNAELSFVVMPPIDSTTTPATEVTNQPPPNIIPDGGTLVCSISENICTGEIYKTTSNQKCHSTTDSDVPGPIMPLCYDDSLPTYYPRERTTFSSGGNKWPQGEKYLFSAETTAGNIQNNINGQNATSQVAPQSGVSLKEYFLPTSQTIQLQLQNTTMSSTNANFANDVDTTYKLNPLLSCSNESTYVSSPILESNLLTQLVPTAISLATTPLKTNAPSDTYEKLSINTPIMEINQPIADTSNRPLLETISQVLIKDINEPSANIPTSSTTPITSSDLDTTYKLLKNDLSLLSNNIISALNLNSENNNYTIKNYLNSTNNTALNIIEGYINKSALNSNKRLESYVDTVNSKNEADMKDYIRSSLGNDLFSSSSATIENYINSRLTINENTLKTYMASQFASSETNLKTNLRGSEVRIVNNVNTYTVKALRDHISPVVISQEFVSGVGSLLNDNNNELKRYIGTTVSNSDANIKSQIDKANANAQDNTQNIISAISNGNADIKSQISGVNANAQANTQNIINAIVNNSLDIKSQIVDINADHKASSQIISAIYNNTADIKSQIDNINMNSQANSQIINAISNSTADIKSQINNINANSQANSQIINAISNSTADIKSQIDNINANSQANAQIISAISNSTADIKSQINSTNNAISNVNTNLSSVVSASQNDIKNYIGTAISNSEQNIISQLSHKIDSISSTITNLISSTTIQIENFIQNTISPYQTLIIELLNSGSLTSGGNGLDGSLIHKLIISDSVTQIINYYSELISGNYDAVASSLTSDHFIQLSSELYKLKSILPITSDYEVIRKIIVMALEALMQMINKQIEYNTLQNSYNVLSEKAGILDDITKLKEYITILTTNTSMELIPEVTVNAPPIGLKPEIAAYIELYGYPTDGMFDPDKLAAIVV